MSTVSKRVDGLLDLESVEKDLQAELSRQMYLDHLDRQHRGRAGKISQWLADKQAWLGKMDTTKIVSSSAARVASRENEGFQKEGSDLRVNQYAELTKRGDVLRSEGYGGAEEVKAREAAVLSELDAFDKEAASKTPLLADALARETKKEAVALMMQVHATTCKQSMAWIAGREEYLKSKPVIGTPHPNLEHFLASTYELMSCTACPSRVAQCLPTTTSPAAHARFRERIFGL